MRYRYALLPLVLLLTLAPTPAHAQEGTVEERSFSSENFPRDYLLYVPSSYDGSQPVPLVLNFHGFALPALRTPAEDHMAVQSRMNAVAEANGFLVAYPTGRAVERLLTEEVGRAWNVPGPYEADHDDVAFARELLTDIAADYAVEPSRIYATGWGNGGELAFALACALSERFAAVASVAGPMSEALLGTCEATRPISALLIHGTADPVFPADGVPDAYPAAEATPAFWAARNGCAATPTSTALPDVAPDDGSTATLLDYPDCSGDTEVQFIRLDGGGHGWPGNSPDQQGLGPTNRDLDGSETVWAFFERIAHPDPLPTPLQTTQLLEFPTYTEGIVFDAEGNAYISEVGRGLVFKKPVEGDTTRWGEGLVDPIGHKILPDGTHLVCDGALKAVVRLSAAGDILGFAADRFEGDALLGPNDLVLDEENGGFYFTDPGPPSNFFEGITGAVYHVDAGGTISLVADALKFPQGVVIDAERRRLYVGEAVPNQVVSIDIRDDGTYGPPEFLAQLSQDGDGLVDFPDGMVFDEETDYLYATNHGVSTIAVIAPSGVRVADYDTGMRGPTNLVFRDTDEGRSLYVVGGLTRPTGSARGALTRLDFVLPPVATEDEAPMIAGPTLDAAYPNPFASSATVRFYLDAPAAVRLDAYDLLGRRVAILARGAHVAGSHAVPFDGARLASGVYVLRLVAGPAVAQQVVTHVK